MTLRRVTLAALVAMATAFLVRGVATFSPGAFGHPAAALAGVGLLALAALAVAAFFLEARRHYRAPDRAGLRMAAAGAALGWLAVFALHVARAAALADPALGDLVPSPVPATVVPLAASILAVVFFGALGAATRGETLARPVLAGLLGTFALAVAQVLVLVRLAAPGAARMLPEPTRELAIVVSPLGAGAFAAVVYFLWAFAREAGPGDAGGQAVTPGPAPPPGRSR